MVWYTGIGCAMLGILKMQGWVDINLGKVREDMKDAVKFKEGRGTFTNMIASILRVTPFFLGISAGIYYGLTIQGSPGAPPVVSN